MGFGSARDEKMIATAAVFLSGLLLVFGVVPLLNVGVSTPFLFGISVGTLLGAVLLYVGYKMFKGHV